jgi:hypothetical protein
MAARALKTGTSGQAADPVGRGCPATGAKEQYMIKRSAALTVILLGLASAAQALEFQPLGSGSLGVGGAGVARTYGAMAPYWNPAGLAFAPKSVTVSLTAAAGITPEGKLAQDLDDLSKAKKAWDNSNQSDLSSLPQAIGLANALNALNDTTSKDNLRLTVGAALGVQVKHLGFGVFGTFEGGAIPNPNGAPLTIPSDAASLAAFQASATSALNAKTVSVRGIALIEAPLSYGYAIDLGGAGKLGIGATAKYLYGAAMDVDKHVFDASSNSTISSNGLTHDLSKDLSGSSSFGIDVGMLWKPLDAAAFGLVAKNLNSPSFHTAAGEEIVAGRQVRAGLSLTPLSWLELTGDVDVLSNATIVPGLKTQHLGGGVELHPFSCLKLRAGGYTDLVSATSGAVTAGLSLGIPWFYFDLDAAYGMGSVRYNNATYPTEAKVQFSTNLAF